ncbi:MAG: hypothetical protein WCC17_00350 [Candidatus Nitrosopolaris sp.]
MTQRTLRQHGIKQFARCEETHGHRIEVSLKKTALPCAVMTLYNQGHYGIVYSNCSSCELPGVIIPQPVISGPIPDISGLVESIREYS